VALENSQELTAQNLNSYLGEQLHLKNTPIDLDMPNEGIDLEKAVENLEKALLIKALDKTKGIKKKAAELLHINFRSMRYRLEKYGLNEGEES
jgi:two-component system response regulator PilR (NtrC family)